jgi:cytochrome c oxidase subunit 4
MRREVREAAKVPVLGLLALLILLALNILLAFLRVGWIRPLIAPLISAVMAVILLAWYMRLTRASIMLRLVAAIGFLWLCLMIGLSLTDYLARPLVPPPW